MAENYLVCDWSGNEGVRNHMLTLLRLVLTLGVEMKGSKLPFLVCFLTNNQHGVNRRSAATHTPIFPLYPFLIFFKAKIINYKLN